MFCKNGDMEWKEAKEIDAGIGSGTGF